MNEFKSMSYHVMSCDLRCLHNVSFPFGHLSVIGLQQVVEFIQLILSALQVLSADGQV